MTGLHKFSLKKLLHITLAIAVVCAVTWKSNARRITKPEIYSTLTRDTSQPQKKDTLFQNPISPRVPNADTSKPEPSLPGDSLRRIGDTTIRDTTLTQRVDTFSLRMSKDTL